MAHKKGQGSSKNGRDSNPQYLGIKLYAGETAKPGAILVRQNGTKFHPGFNVRRGKDDTLFSTAAGSVVFQNSKHGKKIHVDPYDDDVARPQWLREYRAKAASN